MRIFVFKKERVLIEIKRNLKGKYTLTIDGVVIGDRYNSQSKACEKAFKYLKGQNK
jgi:hypothetical protein